jgi:Outer membrane protein beta-barrel domain
VATQRWLFGCNKNRAGHSRNNSIGEASMKKSFGLAMTAAVTLLGANAALAGTDVGSWYVAPQIQGLWLDDERVADDDAGFAFSFGRAASEKWNFEISTFSSNHETAGPNKLKIQGLDLAAQRLFYRSERVSPYLMAGIGRQQNRIGTNSWDTIVWKYGVGVLADIAKRPDAGTNLQLRAEMGARRSDDQAGDVLVDYVAGIGLQYSWGATPPTATVMASSTRWTSARVRLPARR